MKRSSQLTAAAGLALAGLCLLSGCGDDRADDGTTAPGGYSAPSPAPAAMSAPAEAAPDPILAGGGAISTSDPLTASGGSAPADPLARQDPMQGRTMPTDHSHWLRGQVHNARLTVLVNGIRQGSYTGMVDQDITMRLRRGVNSVSFVYAPSGTDSSAQLDLIESEHDPPIAPLATFQSSSLPSTSFLGDAGSFKPETQNFSFVAK